MGLLPCSEGALGYAAVGMMSSVLELTGAALLANVEYHHYQSGHMVYVHPPTLMELHDNVADFILRTSGVR